MSWVQIIFLAWTFLMLIPTIASISTKDQWWIRIFDFPRTQIFVLLSLTFIASWLIFSFEREWHFILPAVLFLCLAYQTFYIFPYTVLFPKEVKSATQKSTGSLSQISLLVSNVLTENKHSEKLIDLIQRYQPHLVLTLESDQRWEDELAVIEKKYPYSVKVPQDNLYGMHLYSRLPLEEMSVKNLVEKDIPSIHGYIRFNEGTKIRFHCMHPRPPSPTESDTSTARDAELLLLGEELKNIHSKALVFGDLNDVAWSRTTKLFREISGMLDPRIGRGFFNTFHPKHPFFRWPLDHVFHTRDFTVAKIKRLPSIGSDHFPIYITLNYEPRRANQQEEPESTEEDEKWAKKKIKKGHPLVRKIMKFS